MGMHPETLYSLIERVAAGHGDGVAIEFGDQRMSYAELLDASSRLAARLVDLGAAPGLRVAFCFRKSIDAIVSLFAIIRSGATYVPLDPTWPVERMAAICEDAGIRLWLGTSPPPSGLGRIEQALASEPGDSNAGAIDVWRRCEPCAMPPSAPAEGVANILYTSGSTGRPKGVRITTLSLLHFSDWAAEYFELSPEDRLANHAPYNFDLSTLDIFAAVRAGAAMCPVPEQVKMFPYQMAAFLAERRISVWYSVPSALVMMQLRGRLADHDLSRLRHVIFAGEVMPKPALRALAPLVPRAAWTNLYGPTETNACTYYRVCEADLQSDAPVPIGWPISDTRLWIRDESGRPAAAGESGELWVAGPTVTSGYEGDMALTAARLVPAPDGDGMAYRTGDRVRRREDACLLFEGRIDRMIKCRGHRVEPGEIEAALHQHPGVKEAAVVPIADPVFGNRIKACISPRSGVTLDESALVSFCRDRLPSYMLPDEWRFYESLPRTDREKIDLQALMG